MAPLAILTSGVIDGGEMEGSTHDGRRASLWRAQAALPLGPCHAMDMGGTSTKRGE